MTIPNASRRHGQPYLWPTWVTGLLSGESSCQWAAWLKAHYQYRKRQDDNENNLSVWQAEHAQMVTLRADALRAEGYEVSVEDQNSFKYKGDAATMGGKPDIVAIRGPRALIVDCKTGREKERDFWQVVIYCTLLPLVDDRLDGLEVSGEIQYPTRSRLVTPADVEHAKPSIGQVVRKVAGPEPARSPSWGDCRFCDIAGCPERVSEEPQGPAPKEVLF